MVLAAPVSGADPARRHFRHRTHRHRLRRRRVVHAEHRLAGCGAGVGIRHRRTAGKRRGEIDRRAHPAAADAICRQNHTVPGRHCQSRSKPHEHHHRIAPRLAQHENSVPFFWPFTAAAKMVQAGETRSPATSTSPSKPRDRLRPAPRHPNRVLLDLHTLRLRDFSVPAEAASDHRRRPFAGHSSTIADYHKGARAWSRPCSPAACNASRHRLEGATPEMKDYDIDHYLAGCWYVSMNSADGSTWSAFARAAG